MSTCARIACRARGGRGLVDAAFVVGDASIEASGARAKRARTTFATARCGLANTARGWAVLDAHLTIAARRDRGPPEAAVDEPTDLKLARGETLQVAETADVAAARAAG